MARPMPLLPPVMTATLPCSAFVISSLRSSGTTVLDRQVHNLVVMDEIVKYLDVLRSVGEGESGCRRALRLSSRDCAAVFGHAPRLRLIGGGPRLQSPQWSEGPPGPCRPCRAPRCP